MCSPPARGQGVADAIVKRLTEEAVAAGLSFLRLETGTQQHAAMRFYRRCGFAPCAAFEPYASMPRERDRHQRVPGKADRASAVA